MFDEFDIGDDEQEEVFTRMIKIMGIIKLKIKTNLRIMKVMDPFVDAVSAHQKEILESCDLASEMITSIEKDMESLSCKTLDICSHFSDSLFCFINIYTD